MTGPPATTATWLARMRVPLGFLSAALALALATPVPRSWWAGATVAAAGALVRLWAAGHIEKGREITRSGPYRFVRHPLYLGSTLLGIGFAVAAWNVPVAVLTVLYLGVTLLPAIQTEEAKLDEQFEGAYAEYRAGAAPPVLRPFSWKRAWANGEHRALAGLILVFAFLAWRL